MNLTRVQKAFYLFLILDFILLALAASNLSISHKEAFLFFGQNGLAGYLAHASCSFFGNSKGSSNPHNLVKATIEALSEMRDARMVAQNRGISVEKVFRG